MSTKPQITPTGTAGYNSLHEARGYKGSDENKSFNQELILPRDAGLAFVDELQADANKLHAMEVERRQAAGKSVRFQLPIINYKEVDGGAIKLNFKRRERDGKPVVIDANNAPFTGYVPRDAQIQVAYVYKPYLLPSGIFGVSLGLVAVRVLETGVSAAQAADLFGGPVSTQTEENTDVKDLF